MTPPPCSDYRRVAVIAPGRRVDLAVPGDVVIADLLPEVLGLARIGPADGAVGWALGRIGGPRFGAGRTLDELGVGDGDVLLLRPTELPDPSPVVDDITDVVAATAAERGSRQPDWAARLALVVGGTLLVAALPAVWGHRSSPTAVLTAAAVLLVGSVAGRRLPSPSPAPLLGMAAVGYAAVGVTGLLGVPAAAEPLLVAVLLLVGSPLTAAVTGTGRRTFTAATTAAALGALTGAAHLLGAGSGQIAVGLLVLASSALPWAPRWAAGLGRLAHPGSAPVDDDTALPHHDLSGLTTAARRTLDHLAGVDLGLAGAIGLSALLLVWSGGTWPMVLAALGVTTLLLRAAELEVADQAVALAVPASVALVGCVLLTGVGLPAGTGPWVPAGAAAAGLLIVAAAVLGPRRAWSPSARRAARRVESLIVLAIVPVAVAAVHGYELLRHR